MKIRVSGRTDTDDFFSLSNALGEARTHTPFLVFVAAADGDVDVHIVDRATELAKYPRETPVMAQWAGKYRSDYFSLTVGAVLDACDKQTKRAETAAAAIGQRPRR